jgi:hypothetical protein
LSILEELKMTFLLHLEIWERHDIFLMKTEILKWDDQYWFPFLVVLLTAVFSYVYLSQKLFYPKPLFALILFKVYLMWALTCLVTKGQMVSLISPVDCSALSCFSSLASLSGSLLCNPAVANYEFFPPTGV